MPRRRRSRERRGAAVRDAGVEFRAQAAVAVVVGVALLVRPHPVVWVVTVLVTASAVGAVLLYRYADVGALGPLPDMYEPTWAAAGKLASAVAEGFGTLLAIIGFVVAVRAPSEGGAARPGLTAAAAARPGRRPEEASGSPLSTRGAGR